jgi:hypothetical protein
MVLRVVYCWVAGWNNSTRLPEGVLGQHLAASLKLLQFDSQRMVYMKIAWYYLPDNRNDCGVRPVMRLKYFIK